MSETFEEKRKEIAGVGQPSAIVEHNGGLGIEALPTSPELHMAELERLRKTGGGHLVTPTEEHMLKRSGAIKEQG